MSIIATTQEVRWSVLIFDGITDRAESPAGRTFATSSEWLAYLHDLEFQDASRQGRGGGLPATIAQLEDAQ